MTLLLNLIEPQNLLFYLFAYGLASIPTSYLVARVIHGIERDRRALEIHSANYIYKNISKSSGILVVILDIFKGLIPAAIAHSLEAPPQVIAFVGFFAVLGHCFSPWLNFSGGFGGAPMAGAVAMIAWPASLVIVLFNWLFVAISFTRARASMYAATLGMVVVFIISANKLVWLMVFLMLLVVVIRNQRQLQ